tara:strand:+ start:111 stop:4580 length:4470 start_codon:yes stop_codon:yes gene_type:complete
MKISNKKKIVRGEGEEGAVSLEADFDLSTAFKRANIDIVNDERIPTKAFAKNFTRKTVDVTPQEQASAALTAQAAISSGTFSTDEVSPTYTPDEFFTNVKGLLANTYGIEALKLLANTNNKDYGRFYYQKIYDALDGNENLKTYFEENYPETVKNIADKSVEFGVTVGEDSAGEPILAGENYTFLGVPSIVKTPAQPFNEEAISVVRNVRDAEDFTQKRIFEVASGFLGLADIPYNFRRKSFEFISTFGDIFNADPSKIGEWRNSYFKNNTDVAQFSKQELENMTFAKLLEDPATETMSDVVLNYIGKKAPFLGIKVAPEEMTAEKTLARPGGRMTIVDDLADSAIAVFTGRVLIEGVKKTPRAFSKKYRLPDGSYDTVALREAIERQRDTSGGVGKLIANMRKAGLDSTRNFWNTVGNEQLLAAGAVGASNVYQDLVVEDSAYFKDKPTQAAASNLTVSLIAPILAVAAGKGMVNLSYNKLIEPIAPSFFNGDFAELADVLKKQNTGFGRRTVREIGRVFETIKQNDPEQYKSLMQGFTEFKRLTNELSQSLIDTGLPAEQVKEITKAINEAKSSAWGVGLFDAAREQYSNSIQFNAGGTLKRKSFARNLEENMEKLANLRRIEDQQEYAVQGYAAAFFQLTKRYRDLEKTGVGSPAEMRTLVFKMRKQYEEIMDLPETKAKKIGNALESVYNISDQYNLKQLNKTDALERIKSLYQSMPDVEKDIFSSILRKHAKDSKVFGNFTDEITKLEELKLQTNKQLKLADDLNSSLRNVAILGPANELNITKPDSSAIRVTQTNLIKSAYNTSKEKSDELYADAFKEADDKAKTVSLADFGADLKDKIDTQGFTYGVSGLKTALQTLSGISTKDRVFSQFINLFSTNEDVLLKNVNKIMENFKDLSLKEAVQLRSEIGTQAFKMRDTNRRGSAVLSDIHSILDTKINDSFSKDSVIGNKLQLANDNYRDNVATVFFDRYTRAALKSEMDIPIPFRQVFNRSTLKYLESRELGEGSDSIILRRDIFDRMFPEESPLRNKAEEQIKETMQLQLFGTKLPAEMSRQEYVKRLRLSVDNPASALFSNKENGGFLDILLGPETNNFIAKNRFAPIIGKDDKIEDVSGFKQQRDMQIKNISTMFDPFDSQTNNKTIGSITKDLAKQLREREELLEVSPTHRVFISIAGSNKSIADAGNALVNEISGHKGAGAQAFYLGLIEDVRKHAPEQADMFETAINSRLTENLIDKVSLRYLENKQPDIENLNSTALNSELSVNKELYQSVFKDDFDGMVSLIKIARVGNTVGNPISFSRDLKEMTESGALSRFWGIARGVVSFRYVGSEFLLRKFAAKNNEALVDVLSIPELPNYIMETVENGVYSASVSRNLAQVTIPSLAAILATKGSDADYDKTLTSLHSFYEASNENKTDFITNLMGLLFAARNEKERNELYGMIEKTAASDKPPASIDVMRTRSLEEQFGVPRRETLEIDVRTPRGNVQ